MAALFVAGAAGCGPGLSAVLVNPGSAVGEVLADGIFTCEEQVDRQQYNVCPAEPPPPGPGAAGVTWSADRFLGLPNPLHAPLDCYRGRSVELGISSYQCCYDGGVLVESGPLAGTFDFAHPGPSVLSLVLHLLWDVLSPAACP